jgi:hypothetical protein
MSKQIWVGACLAVVFAGASVAAQTSGSTSSRNQTASGDVTITGCLQRGGDQAGATGTSGTSSTNPSGTSSRTSGSTSGQFILANATMSGGSGSTSRTGSTTSGTTTGTATGGTTTERPTGSATSGAAGTSGNSFVLEGQDSELTKHVGHKVEITGTLDTSRNTSNTRSGSTSSGTTGAGTTGGTTASERSGSRTGDTSMSQHVRVRSVKMISANCSAE